MSFVVLLLFASSTPGAEGCIACHATTATVAAHAALMPKHASATCLACHRGDGAAKDKPIAHASGPDELLAGARTGAACVACHVAGSVAGTELVAAGGRAYLERGCNFCHSGAFGLGYVGAFAPSLAAIGGRGSQYLLDVIRAPKKIFPATVMPAYALPAGEEAALIAYLLSLRADIPAVVRPAASKEKCGSCHISGTALAAPVRAEGISSHRCAWIKEERAIVACARCHAKDKTLAADKECLFIEHRRKECGRCHEGALDGR